MTTTAQATAAAHTVKIGDQTFRMTPLQDRDYGEFEAWVQDKYISLFKRNLDGLSDDERQRQLDRAFDRAAEIGIHSDEAMNAMCTIDGVSKLIWMSIRREHPDVTEEEIVTLITSPANIRQALDEIDNVNHMKGGGHKKKERRVAAKIPTAFSPKRTGGRRTKLRR